ncbi:MAG: 1-acyl-sn-glycerol-3-phosphate acyltransferase [Acidimicrobiales bacterium]|nr:1-acyl-sn-glycerol-3-phosphate acyltransferase [Acidimicrobiales bacterium]
MKLPAVRVRARFPYGAPTWPASVPHPPVERRTGVDFDTEWARRYPARVARALFMDQVLRPAVRALVPPTVHGVDRLQSLDGPVVFVANHQSHLDTGVLLSTLPDRWRHRAVVAAAADYFFDTRLKATLSALVLGALPVERGRVDRRPLEQARALLDEGWSLVIFPEGGRSPDGWGQPFRGGAAYLSMHGGFPVVPVHIDGTGRVLPKGKTRPSRAAIHVTFGAPLRPRAGESTARFSTRIEQAVAVLADERATDWWTARRRAALGTTPPLTGPDAGAWRRAWTLDRGRRTRAARTWPAP